MAGEPPPAQRSKLTELTISQRELALQRFQILRPFLEDGVPLTRVAQAKGLKLRTAQGWVTRYRRQGLIGLLHQGRADRGGLRRVPPELRRLIEGLTLRKPPPSAAHVHCQVVKVAEQQGWPAPSHSSVYAIIRQLDPSMVTLAHHGPKVYREEFDLLYRREAARPNEIWQADHSPLDVWLLNERDQPARPWLTMVLDDYSRAEPGYFLSFQAPCTLHTSLALHQAIWRKADPRWHICGIRDIFYTDHGSDFTSKHLEQVSADLKIELVFSLPGMPRGRGRIERFFETLNQLFLCRLPAYAPEGSPPATLTLTLAAFEAQFREFLLDEYHQRVHGGTGVAPQARWEAGGLVPRGCPTLWSNWTCCCSPWPRRAKCTRTGSTSRGSATWT